MKRWMILATLLAMPAFASQPRYDMSLLQNGVKASAFGEIALQQDRLVDSNVVSTRLQGGWLLWRSHFVSTTIGASYTGLGAQKRDAHGEVLELGYYGPVADIIVMPDSTVKGLVSYGYENGFIKRMVESGDRNYGPRLWRRPLRLS